MGGKCSALLDALFSSLHRSKPRYYDSRNDPILYPIHNTTVKIDHETFIAADPCDGSARLHLPRQNSPRYR